MSDGEDDLPLSTRARVAIAGNESDSDDDVPLSARVPGAATEKRVNMSNRNKPAHKRKSSDTEDDNILNGTMHNKPRNLFISLVPKSALVL